MAGSGRLLVNAARGGVHSHDTPVDPAFYICVGLDSLKDLLPGAVRRPPPMTIVNSLPLPEARGQVPPRNTGPQSEENAVDNSAMVLPTPAPTRVPWEVRLQSSPLSIRQITPPHTGLNDPAMGPPPDSPDRP
ncbi:hypothetical protein GCM10010260_30970 [Streptomyces filipinensis]|uniref:Uncharacterized protein n=1 Tax=Streptomyces filipinensis TaxID=66887 RepID=A0A918MBN6_9ACTN|nr:hypothetical protein GCM10010260_30970 [Streptomyces filipinensis]